jgi:hypothetical protein
MTLSIDTQKEAMRQALRLMLTRLGDR